MFDDSSDESPEKEERNLNWTPAEVPPGAAVTPTAGKRRQPPGKDSGLINLCASVPPVPGCAVPAPDGRAGLVPASAQGSERPEGMAGWSPAARTLRNITNNSDIQQANRPSNVAHVRPKHLLHGVLLHYIIRCGVFCYWLYFGSCLI